MNLQPHQQRVVDEKTELDTKLSALDRFQRTHTYMSLDMAERVRLLRQKVVMHQYSTILGERIAAFTLKDTP